jgi:NAD(P)-dependent dehydrogenase (short-subunit alcohol dehydrogenase family)
MTQTTDFTPSAPRYNILILGASYGALLAIKCLAAGHNVTVTCRTATAELINAEGIRVRLPIKGRPDISTNGLLEVASNTLQGQLQASTPQNVGDLKAFDLVVLAMQEPQYSQDGIQQLMARIAASGLPCMPIMNMPPLPYLSRLKAANPALDVAACRPAYADPTIWDAFDPALMTLSSPDPQAFRPVDEPVNVLQVALATNFKAARFESEAHTQILRQLDADIEAVRISVTTAAGQESVELPVKLKVFDSLFVPLAKWSMLLTGNYRCIQATEMRPIRDAILSDRAASQDVYEWVAKLCVSLGAAPSDLVPFEKYAAAANGLAKPSSAARALLAGAKNIERVDIIVQALAQQLGMNHPSVDQTVVLVEQWLTQNRAA